MGSKQNNDKTVVPQFCTFHFTVYDKDTGDVVEQSEDNAPVQDVLGRTDDEGERIGWPPRIEDALLSMRPGSTRVLELKCKQAWGEWDADEVIPLDVRVLEQEAKMQAEQDPDSEPVKIEEGAELNMWLDDQEVVGTIEEIKDGVAHIDCNHPCAGLDVRVELRLIERRQATQVELMRADEGMDD